MDCPAGSWAGAAALVRRAAADSRNVPSEGSRAEVLLEADRHKNEFLAVLAHELRNPLAPDRRPARRGPDYEAARCIRERKGHDVRPVLVALTGWGQDEDRERSKKAGFDAHVVKPVDEAALRKLLAELVPSDPRVEG